VKTRLQPTLEHPVSGTEKQVRLDDSEILKDAHVVRNKLERKNEIPKQYTDIKNNIRSRLNDFAYIHVPKMYFALRKAGFDIETAKLTVIADGFDLFHWSVNTIRKSIPKEAKNQKKAIGARAAAIQRNKNKEERQKKEKYTADKDSNGDAEKHIIHANIESVTVQKATYTLSRKDVESIWEISEKLVDDDGSVIVQFDENGKLYNVSPAK